MKRFYKFLMPLVAIVAMAMPWNVRAQVTCDSGDPVVVSNADTATATSSYFPGYSYYNYSFSEVLILADDLMGIGDIKALQFKPASTLAGSHFTNCEIYLANTDLENLGSGFLNDSNAFELVWSGDMSYTSTDWQTIVFDDPFAWDGTSNVIVAVRRNHGQWTSGSSFVAFNAGAPMGRYVYQDSGPYTIGSLPNGTSSNTVAWYKLIGCEGTGDVCYRVRDVQVSDVTSDGFTVSWTDTLNWSASYIIYDMTDTSVIGSTSSTTYTVTGLDANTTYNLAVVADCGSIAASYARFTVHTACGGYTTVPYSDGFEGLATGEVPTCWQQVSTGTSGSGTFPSAYVWTNSRTGSVYFEFESNSGQTEVVALPAMSNINTLKLTFWASLMNHNFVLEVGVMEDTLFVPVDTLENLIVGSGGNWHGSYHEYTVFFSDYYGSGERMAMRVTSNGSYTLMIDDLSVSENNGCNKPNDAVIDSVGPYSVDLHWSTGGALATSYTLFYGTQNDIASATAVSGIGGTSYTLTGLQPQTTYYAWVRTDCGGDSSEVQSFGSFTTQLTCAQLTSVAMGDVSYTAAAIQWDYNTTVGFSSSEVVITLIDNTDTTAAPLVVSATSTSYVFTGLTAGHGYTAILRNVCDAEGQSDTASSNTISFMTTSCAEIVSDGSTNNYIPTYTYYGNTYAQMIYLASEMPNITAINGIAFNITTRNSTNNTIRPFDVYVSHIDTSAFNGTNFVAVDSSSMYAAGVMFNSSQTGWQVIPFDSAFVYNGSSNLLITINDRTGAYGATASYASFSAPGRGLSSYRDGATSQYDPATMTTGTARNNIPAIRFVADCEVPTCFAPMVTVDDVDSGSISIHWTSEGIETSWAVGIKAAGEAHYTYLPTAVTDTFYTFTGLNAATNYTIIVGSLCVDTLNTTVTAQTECGIVTIPYFTDFEGLSTGQLPACWTAVQTGNSGSGTFPSAYNYSSNAYNGSIYFEFESNSGQTEVAALPAMDNINTLMLSFYASVMNANFVLEAGVMEGNTFVPVDTVNLTVGSGGNWHGSYNEYEIPFSSYTGTGNRIALRVTGTGSYTLMMDDLGVSVNTGCYRPSMAVVDSVSGSDIYLHWASTPSGSYEVAYSTVNDVDDNSTMTVTVNDTTAVISGLDPMTQYYLWVRSLCSGGNSNWRDAGSAATQCDTTTCDVTIDMVDSYGDGWNGNAIYVYQAGIRIGEATIASGSTGTANISVCSSAPVEFRFHVGSYASEASVTIYDGGGAQLYSQSGMGSVSEGTLLTTATDPCPSCITPHGLTLVTATTNDLTLEWTPGGSEGEWEVTCNGVTTIVTTPTITLYGLDASTTYPVQVRAICDVDDTSATATANFSTLCSTRNLPYVEDFNTTAATTYSSEGVLPLCWEGYSTGTNSAYNPHVVGSGSYWYSNDNTNALTLTSGSSTYGDTKIVALPVLNANLSTCQMSFYYRMESASSGTLEVGYFTGYDLATDFVPVDTMTRTTTITFDSVSFAGIPATAVRLGFRWTYSSSFYSVGIDNIAVTGSGAVACPAPTALNVTAAETTVTMNWSGSAASYEVACVAGNWTEPAAPTPVSGATHTFTGLTPATQYAVGVRAVCDAAEGLYSEWVVNTVTTAELPCPTPTHVTVPAAGITVSSAQVSWTADASQSQFELRYSTAGDTSYVTTTSNPTTLTGLLHSTTYSVAVRAICAEGVYSDWSDAESFTTESCPTVSNVTVSNRTQTTATITWSSNGYSTYELGYGPIGTTTDNCTRVSTTGTSYTISGLEAGTAYVVYVHTVCAEGVYGAWTDPGVTFQTEEEIGIEDVDDATIALYPNPASSTVTLSGMEGVVTVTVVDMNGRESGKWTVAEGTLTIDVSGYAQGAYFVRITGEKVNAIRKLIVR